MAGLMTRRKFLALGALAFPAAIGADAACVEPTNLQVTNFVLNEKSQYRCVHFTDLHYKGNAQYAAEVVRTINSLTPQFVLFTGDLVEDKRFAAEALNFIRQIAAPVYGSPGNHDYWSHVDFNEFGRVFAGTGGAWLVDRSIVLPQHDLEIVGMGILGTRAFQPAKAKRRLLLMHFPEAANHLDDARFDLILAGHSHGGQVRLPWYGPPILPWGVGRYDLGYFDTPGGPLYVNAGIGTYYFPFRFNCRPEVTVVTM